MCRRKWLGSEHVAVVGVLAKDGGVDAFDLFLLADADWGDLVDDPEDGVGEYEAVDGGEEGGHYLLEEEIATAGDEAVGSCWVDGGGGEHAEEDGAYEAADAVYAPYVHGVVPLALVLPFYCEIAECRGCDADERCAPQWHEAGAWSDGGKTCDGAGEHAYELGLAAAAPLDDEPGDEGEGGGDVGVEEGEGGDAVGAYLATGIEAVPAEPEEAGADGYERDAVGGGVLVDAGAYEEYGGEGCEAGEDVYGDTAGEVEHAPFGEDAAAPYHVAERVVAEELPEGEEDEVGLEADAVDEGAGDEGGGEDGEHHLE